ncbi:LAFA_0F01728g1_1 [Lachancea sp. 'fantastica']|nr:LAFA_0F01728g1_1 [Lachancea sp. 'fantastica']
MSSNALTSDLDVAVDHLVTILHHRGFAGKIQEILDNLVYYIPRLRRKRKLEELVSAFLESKLWSSSLNGDRTSLQEAAEAIFSWKLSISEPVISVFEFYEVWDRVIMRCPAWNINKLTILIGILGTRDKFGSLQRQYFLDNSHSVYGKYAKWRDDLFVPVWRQLFKQSLGHSPRDAEDLAVLMACVFTQSEVLHEFLNQFVSILLHLSLAYIRDYKNSPVFVSRNLGSIAKTLEYALCRTDAAISSNALNALTATIFDMSLTELHAPRANYSTQTHSNQLLTVVSILRGCFAYSPARSEKYGQAIMSLFYVDFLAQDFGKTGFYSYEYVYKLCVAACTFSPAEYYGCLDTMRGNIYQFPNNNVVNKSRILFLLNFLEASLGPVPITPRFLEEYLAPVVTYYAASSDAEICEAAHAAQLCIYGDKSGDHFLQVWKRTHYLKFLEQAVQRYFSKVLSPSQLIHIFAVISQEIPALRLVDPDVSREILQYTYLRILNSRQASPEELSTLIQCLVKQLPHIDAKYITDWLENCIELTQICPPQKEKILDCLWEQITSGQLSNDRALEWFLKTQSKF